MRHSSETLGEMLQRYRDIESKVCKFWHMPFMSLSHCLQAIRISKRIEQEKSTLTTIVTLRGKAGALFGVINAKDKDKAS